MSEHILKIRKVDKPIFDLIKSGVKTIETRAATDKYRNIQAKDKLVFHCEGQKVTKVVKTVYLFKSIKELLNKLPLTKILPGVKSFEEAEKVWVGFPNYPEKIKKYGLVAWELE